MNETGYHLLLRYVSFLVVILNNRLHALFIHYCLWLLHHLSITLTLACKFVAGANAFLVCFEFYCCTEKKFSKELLIQ
jgi:hypothetical protein